MKYIGFVLIFLVLIVNTVAQENNTEYLYCSDFYSFPFNMEKPTVVFKLPEKLNEISGLSYYKKNELAVVQDEKGNIYIFDIITGKVTNKIDFSDDGDYEGIEVVNEQIWVLKSNGDLYKVDVSKKGNTIKTKEYKTELTAKNDAEGLAFDKINNRLLIACKGRPYFGDKKDKNKKAVYSFDISKKEMFKKPVIKIKLDYIRELKNYNTMAKLGVEFLTYINPSKGDVSFQPSGIAIHPYSKNIYLLASVGKLLIVCDNNGEFLSVIKLNSMLFFQPEGICFDPSGNLYISNEGKDLPATILKFQPK